MVQISYFVVIIGTEVGRHIHAGFCRPIAPSCGHSTIVGPIQGSYRAARWAQWAQSGVRTWRPDEPTAGFTTPMARRRAKDNYWLILAACMTRVFSTAAAITTLVLRLLLLYDGRFYADQRACVNLVAYYCNLDATFCRKRNVRI